MNGFLTWFVTWLVMMFPILKWSAKTYVKQRRLLMSAHTKSIGGTRQ